MVAGLLATSAADAQSVNCDSTKNPWTFLKQCMASALPAGDTIALARGLQQAVTTLRQPYSLNPALAELGEVTHTRRFIGALNLSFVSIQQGYTQSMAMAYDWRKDIARTRHRQGESHWGAHSGIEARGLLATAQDSNPENFSDVAVHASVFYARGGAGDPAVMRAHLRGIADSAANFKPSEAYLSSPQYLSLMAGLWDSLGTQIYFTGGPEARHEYTQGGARTQTAYGIRIGVDLKAWNPHSTLARYNIFDWPTALVRLATGTDARFRPSGAAIPSVSVIFRQVKPGTNAQRDSVDDLHAFTRLAFEVRYRTKLASVPEGPIWLAVEYRHHRELDPSEAIVAARLHRHGRVQLQAEVPGGFILSWARGNMPLSETHDDRWGLGFQFKFR